MDLTSITNAIEAYEDELSENERTRLAFFAGLWKLQQDGEEGVENSLSYELPSKEQLVRWYWKGEPLFALAPPQLDTEYYLEFAERCAAYLANEAGLSSDAAAALRACKWSDLFAEGGLTLEDAAVSPAVWLAKATEAAHRAADPVAAAARPPYGVVFASALRTLLEPYAKQALAAFEVTKEDSMTHDKPLRCPVCGSAAHTGYVGPTPLSEGNGRMLYCAHCATTWEFERIRCAHCGSTNQSKLHYFHIEGDAAHRLHLCKECDQYLRTTFAADLARKPFNFEVEDVVMVKLEQVAQESR